MELLDQLDFVEDGAVQLRLVHGGTRGQIGGRADPLVVIAHLATVVVSRLVLARLIVRAVP